MGRSNVEQSAPSSRGPALARVPAKSPLWENPDFQNLWMTLQRSQWRSLAFLAASKEVDTFAVAETMAKIAWSNLGQPIAVVDFRDLSVRLLNHQMTELLSYCQAGEHALVALRSIQENPTARSVAERVDAVVLCIELERTPLAEARKTIQSVGHNRFVGVLVVSPPAR